MKNILLAVTFVLIYSINVFAQDDFFEPKSTLGGYGELHYNYSKPEGGNGKKVLDFHRFVLFFGHSWNEKWSFKSEVELEHNFVYGQLGELELEQAYVNYHHAEWFGFQAGVILPSVGLLNEYHEPPLFLSVERPVYANVLIPTTWFGNGAAIYSKLGGFDLRFAAMEGLNSDKFSANGIRSARRKGYLAKADNLLYNFSANYTNIPGLLAGASFSYNKADGDSTTNKISIAEFHAKYEANNIYSAFEIGTISFEKGNVENSLGYYFDLGYNIGSLFNTKTEIIPWFRYSDINTAALTRNGGDSEKANHNKAWFLGLTVKPIPQVVFKTDYSVNTLELNSRKTNYFNIGVGYMF